MADYRLYTEHVGAFWPGRVTDAHQYVRLICNSTPPPTRRIPVTVWTVPATVTRVIDGDTIVADLDLGWGVTMRDRHIRLAGLNCPEINTPEGVKARDFTRAKMIGQMPADGVGRSLAAPVTVVSHSLDKYGRVLGTVFYTVGPGGSLNDDLLASGNAVVMK